MRRLVLTASLLVFSASADAGSSRNLTLAPHEGASEQSAPTRQSGEEAKDLAKAPVANTAMEARPSEQVSAPPSKTTAKTADSRSRHKTVSTEARVIYELHRYGIYW